MTWLYSINLFLLRFVSFSSTCFIIFLSRNIISSSMHRSELLHFFSPYSSSLRILASDFTIPPLSHHTFSYLFSYPKLTGYLEMITSLNRDLAEITGFAAVSAQPNSGAQVPLLSTSYSSSTYFETFRSLLCYKLLGATVHLNNIFTIIYIFTNPYLRHLHFYWLTISYYLLTLLRVHPQLSYHFLPFLCSTSCSFHLFRENMLAYSASVLTTHPVETHTVTFASSRYPLTVRLMCCTDVQMLCHVLLLGAVCKSVHPSLSSYSYSPVCEKPIWWYWHGFQPSMVTQLATRVLLSIHHYLS